MFTVQLQNSQECEWLNDLYKVCFQAMAFTTTQPSGQTLCQGDDLLHWLNDLRLAGKLWQNSGSVKLSTRGPELQAIASWLV